METIAQQLNVKEFPFIVKDSNGKVIYSEHSDGYWYKREYDSNGNEIFCKTSTGSWVKREYNSLGKEIYYENSNGTIIDNRPKKVIPKTRSMYLAINKHNRNEYHSFVWDEDDNLIINWVKVNPADWDIIEVFEDQGPAFDGAGFSEADREPSHHCDDLDCNCSI